MTKRDGLIMTRYRCEYERWLQNADEESVRLLKEIENDDREIEYRFSKNLSFGTAGLRGVMMPGLYAMNAYTVGAATAGLARYIRAPKSAACSSAAIRGCIPANTPREPRA